VPRLFPAAKQEQYDPQTTLLRTMEPKSLLFVHTIKTATGSRSNEDHPVIQAATKRFHDYLHRLPDYPEDYPVNPQNVKLVPIQNIHLSLQDKNHTIRNGDDGRVPHTFDESYQIQIDSTSKDITVAAKTVFGIVRGLESLAQLVEFGWMTSASSQWTRLSPAKKTPVFVIRNTPLFIADAPAYSYRGLMIDTSRHYLPLDLILHNLDVMAMNKLNVLHWHMTDAQSWPFESTTYPELSEHGAYSKHAVYTHENVQQVIHEAYLRGIRVIPEFDLPGHSQVLEKSHPELLSKCPRAQFAQPLNPTLPIVYDFVEKLYQEVTALFTDDFIHIGGDEVRLDCWKQDPQILAWAKGHNDMTANQLLNYFESILTDIVFSCDKTPIAWQELLNEGVELPPGTVIDVWKGFDTATIENATKAHYPVIISGCWYLDHLKDDWRTYYACEPLAFNGTKAQKELVIGGHASMWGERVDATDFMMRVWPHASAVAERLWSGSLPKSYHDVLSKTVEERLVRFRCFMVLRGVTAAPIEPGSCRHEQPYPPTSLRQERNGEKEEAVPFNARLRVHEESS